MLSVGKILLDISYRYNVFNVAEQQRRVHLGVKLCWKSEWLYLNIFHFTHPTSGRLCIIYEPDPVSWHRLPAVTARVCVCVSDCGNTGCVCFQGFSCGLLHIHRLLLIRNNGFEAAGRRLLMFVCVSAWEDLTGQVISVLSMQEAANWDKCVYKCSGVCGEKSIYKLLSHVTSQPTVAVEKV